MHRNQAIVAVARQLLELVWYVLTRRQPYRHFSQERIAYKYLTWAWQMDEAARDGLTRQQFTRYYLMRLGIGHDLTRIALDPKHPRKMASVKQNSWRCDRNWITSSNTSPFVPLDWTQPHPKTQPGVGLEGCPYSKNNQQKTARIMQHPDRFLFLLLFLIFLWLTP